MPYRAPPVNATLEQLLADQSMQIPLLWPFILFFIFVVLAGSGFIYLESRARRASLPVSCSVAGLITTTLAFILFLIPGLIGLETLVVTVIISIASAIWMFVSGND